MNIAVSAYRLTTEDDFRKAGVGRHTMEVISALGRLGGDHRFDILLTAGVRGPDEWYSSPNLRVHEIKPPPKKMRRLWEHFTTESHARRVGADANFALYSVIPFRPKLPTVGMIHDAFPKTHPELFKAQDVRRELFFQSSTCRWADLVVTISDWSKAELSRAYRTPMDKFRVVPNAIGNALMPKSDPLPERSDYLKSRCDFDRYLFALSTIEPRKNLHRLLQAFAQLKQQPQFSDVGLVIGGGMGWKQTEILQFTKQLGLDASVIFLGYVPDEELQSLYEHCAAFVFPSLLEGFGIPLLEAMTVGVPVVTSNTSALPFVAGGAAFYCDPLRSESIAEQIQLCLTDTALRSKRVELGLTRSQDFSWDKAAQLLIPVFEEAKRLRR